MRHWVSDAEQTYPSIDVLIKGTSFINVRKMSLKRFYNQIKIVLSSLFTCQT